MLNRIGVAVVAAILMLTSACGGNVASLPPLTSASSNEYRLGPGDELRILVTGLSGADASSAPFVVNDRGELTLPLVGAVSAAGQTIPELERNVAARFVERQLLVSPTVSIQPVRLRPFYILGEVNKPGEYPYRPGMSVLAAISVAGGYTFRANQKNVAIVRTQDGRSVTNRAADQDLVQPGDTIRVYERWF